MATVTTEAVAEIVSSSNTASYDFGAFVPTGHALLVIIALCRGTTAAGSIVNVSGTSLTWTKKTSGTFNSGADTVYLYWARTPASPSSSVYRVSTTGDNATGCIAYMFQITGSDANIADPIKQAVANSGNSTNATTGAITALDTNDAYVMGWMGDLSSSNPANVSAPPNGSWTEIGDNGFSLPTSNGSGAFRDGGETGTSLAFVNNSAIWGLIFAEITRSIDPSAQADTMALADEFVPIFVTLLDKNETITLSDDNSKIFTTLLDVSDTITLSDAIEVVLAYLFDLSDTITITDSIESQLYGDLQIDISDTLSFSDAISIETSYQIDVTDSITFSDAQAIEEGYWITLEDTFVFADAIETNLANEGQPTVDVQDTLVLSDSFNAIFTIDLELSEVLSFSDIYESIAEYRISIEDSFSLSDEITVQFVAILSVEISDTLSLQDEAEMHPGYGVEVSDSLSLTDGTETINYIALDLTDTITLADVYNGIDAGLLNLAEAIGFSDSSDVSNNIVFGLGSYAFIVDHRMDMANKPRGL